jgi:SAM-dependent methyltransferase
LAEQRAGRWWLDERSFAGPEHLDPGYVAAYDAKAQFDPTSDIEVLGSLGLDGGSSLIDLGAGTGTFAVAAAELGATVTAVDVSPTMVAAIRRRCHDRGLDGVDVVEAGFLSYEHRGPPADFAFSRNALHQLPDFWKVIALRRVAAMLRPGGILRLRDLAYDFAPAQVEGAFGAWLANAASDPATGYTAGDLAQHIKTEFSTFSWLLEPMLERTGFEIIDRDTRWSVHAAYTCRKLSDTL